MPGRLAVACVSIVLLVSHGSFGETNVPHQTPLTVHASRLESAARVGQDASVAAALTGVGGVDVVSQGLAGGQSDLSIRGSGFSGAGLVLSGAALASPQTEHFNLELPLPPALLTAPEVLTGMDQAIRSEGHLVGSIAYAPLLVTNRRLLTVGAAENGGYWANALMQQVLPVSSSHGAVGLGGFGGAMRAYAVDYPDNDVEVTRAGGQVQWVGADTRFDAAIGRQEKTFGARGYYGVTDAWAATERLDDTLVLASWVHGDTADAYTRATAIRREIEDAYTLFWTLPGTYDNRHRTVIHGGLVDGRVPLAGAFDLAWRVSAQDDTIRSGNLGNHARTHGSILAVPGADLGAWRVDIGARHDLFERAPDLWLPQAAVARQLGDACRLGLSHVQTARQPSFTELNYESPASLGHAGLGTQTSAQTELAADGGSRRGTAWRAAAFHRRTSHTVDWIRATAEAPRWEAADIGVVDTIGAEAALSRRFDRGSRLGVQYTWLDRDHEAGLYASRYALDYAEHLLAVSGWLQLGGRAAVEVLQGVRAQVANRLRSGGDESYPARAALHLRSPWSSALQLTLCVENAWDDDFEPFPGQRTTPPRRASAAVTAAW